MPRRITKRERAAIDLLYEPFYRTPMHAFSHSPQCDGYFERGKSELQHERCGCWCHVAATESVVDVETFLEYPLQASDLEYQRDLDTRSTVATNDPVMLGDDPSDPECELCGDPMSKCECVE